MSNRVDADERSAEWREAQARADALHEATLEIGTDLKWDLTQAEWLAAIRKQRARQDAIAEQEQRDMTYVQDEHAEFRRRWGK